MKTTVHLSKEDLVEIIDQHLKKRFSSVGEIKIIVKKELVGFANNEHYEAVFDGVECEVGFSQKDGLIGER